MKIIKFEDIIAWQKSRVLTKIIYSITSKGDFSRDFRLRDQIRSASASIMANIAEGFDSKSDKEFIGFLSYSRRSASEVQSHLYVAVDQKYISEDRFRGIYNNVKEVKKLIFGLIRYLGKGKIT